MTQRLYYDDSHIRTFSATVSAVRDTDAGPRIALDRTAFYPGGGGQPPDLGTIGSWSVLEVAESEGDIWHRIDGTVEAGATVECAVDWARRFDHMQQHTGQHILSRAFVEIARADTRSFHLGDEVVTIDVDHADPDPALLARVEAHANQAVWDDRPVVIHLVSLEEARRFPLRKAPDVEGTVRVVEISEYDWSACGGTHVRRSGEVGQILILGTERYKGGTRVSFVAGGRALRRARETGDLLRRVCLEFSTGEGDLPNAISRLKEERERLDRRLRPLLRESLEREADRLLAGAAVGPHGPVVALFAPDRTAEELGQLAGLLVSRGATALLIGGSDTPRAHFSAPAGTLSMGALLGDICRRHGGRGGGRAESAQGTIPRPSVEAALGEAREAAMAGREKGATA
ncbi:MAG: alanyl-tRNA editing protein [Candidatus Eiseniibacteriota bacterium]